MSLWLGQLGNHASRMTINLIDWTILDTFDYQNALGYGVDIFLLQLGLNRYRRLVFFLWICHLRMQLRGPKEIKYLSEWKVKMPILLGIGFKQRWNKKSSPRLLLVIWSETNINNNNICTHFDHLNSLLGRSKFSSDVTNYK